MTSPVSLPAGSLIIAAKLDAYENLTGVWQSYTPVWSASTTQPALGNGTLTGVYRQTGKTVNVRIKLVTGSTSTYGSGVYSLSLPVIPKLDSLLSACCIGANKWGGVAQIVAATMGGDNMRIAVADNTPGVGSTVPFTWAAANTLIIAGSYEAV